VVVVLVVVDVLVDVVVLVVVLVDVLVVVLVVVVVVVSHSPRGVITTSPVDDISPVTVHITNDCGPVISTGPRGS
jgi:hypothetical protein